MVIASRCVYRMIKLFENKAHVEQYAHYRPTWPSQVSQAVIDFTLSVNSNANGKDDTVPTKKGFYLVDVGSGSGQSTPMYAPFCENILGLDPSAEQVKHAKNNNTYKNIEYKVGTGENMPLPDESADIICCAQSAHWMDYDVFFKECKRVLQPQGVLAVYGYTMATIAVQGEKIPGHCNALFQNFFKQCDFHPRRAHVDNRMSEYFSILPAANKIRNDTMTIHRDWNLADLEGYIQSWSGYRKLMETKRSGDILGALRESIMEASGTQDPASTAVKVDWSVFMILSGRPNDLS